MLGRRLLAIILIGLACPIPAVSIAQTALNDSQRALLADALGPRPDIRDYNRQDRFVTDLLAWQGKRSQLAERLSRGEPIVPPPPPRASDWHHVTGPENLDTALRNARGYQQPNYREPTRYNRTTHLSFPLPPLPQQKLSEKALTGKSPVVTEPTKGEIPETLLEDNTRLQREMAASQADLPAPTFNRRHFVNHYELR